MFQTTSLYHERACFWLLDYDATLPKPPESDSDEDSDTESDSNEEEEQVQEEDDVYDWNTLTFRSEEVDGVQASCAGRRLPEETLQHRRTDVTWQSFLLPDTYQASPTRRTTNPLKGGLVGELSLLLGIAAMSLPLRTQTHNVFTLLPLVVAGPRWRVPTPEQVPRGVGCELQHQASTTGFEAD